MASGCKSNENSLCCFISVGIINEKPVKNERYKSHEGQVHPIIKRGLRITSQTYALFVWLVSPRTCLKVKQRDGSLIKKIILQYSGEGQDID